MDTLRPPFVLDIDRGRHRGGIWRVFFTALPVRCVAYLSELSMTTSSQRVMEQALNEIKTTRRPKTDASAKGCPQRIYYQPSHNPPLRWGIAMWQFQP